MNKKNKSKTVNKEAFRMLAVEIGLLMQPAAS